MKITLEFTLPDETAEFELANNATHISSALNDFGNWIREQAKYQNRESIPTEEIQSKFWEIITYHKCGEYF